MFDVIDNAHRHGEKHRGYKGTFKKISATYCNIPREVVHKYVSMCVHCQKMHACYKPAPKGSTKEKKNRVPRSVKKVSALWCGCSFLGLMNRGNF